MSPSAFDPLRTSRSPFESRGLKHYISIMYTTEMGKRSSVKPIGPAEDSVSLDAFEARVAADVA